MSAIPGLDRERARAEKIRAAVCPLCSNANGPIDPYDCHSLGDIYAHSVCVEVPKTTQLIPCVRCGYGKKTRVRWRWEGGSKLVESYRDTCDACDADFAAEKHEREGRRLRAKAVSIRAKRAP